MRVAFGRFARAACVGLGLALVVAALGGSAHAGGPIIATPEIDPGSMGSALTLLIGGAFLLTGRSRKG
jgi:uncharacterized membrane protein YphA (DoxX/SURF4 family)